MYKEGKEIIEEVIYPCGGKLEIYSNGTKTYIPSKAYKEAVKKANKCIVSLSPRERTLATIRHNRNKLLFEKGICISGDKLIDKIFKAPSDTKFDFSEVKIKKRKRFKKK